MRVLGKLLVVWAVGAAGCSAAATQADRVVGPAQRAGTSTAGQVVTGSPPAVGKKRGSGPLFQVRLIDAAAAGRTVRAPGEAAVE